MTLDCYIFLHRCFSQSRVISVHSYYLTSLVTSRFYRFGDKTFSSSQAFLRTNHPSLNHILSFVRSHSAGSYQVEKLSSYGSLYCRIFYPQQFVYVLRFILACYFGKIFIITSIFAACDRLEPLGCYLFIGITLSGYNIAQGNGFCNTQYCTK